MLDNVKAKHNDTNISAAEPEARCAFPAKEYPEESEFNATLCVLFNAG